MRWIIILLFLFSCFFTGQAQKKVDSSFDHNFTVDRIILHGNHKTKSHYILKELGIEDGSIIDSFSLETKVNQLARLNGIFHAEVDSIIGEINKKQVYISLYEQRTLLPIADIGIVENNSWFQIGFVDINVAGIGDELYSYYRNNEGRHSGQLYYKNNAINQSRWGAHMNVLRWNSLEPLSFDTSRLEYDYLTNLIGGGIHFQKNDHHEIMGSSSFFHEKYSRVLNDENLEGPALLELNKLLNKLEHVYSAFRYDGLMKNGAELLTRYQNVYTTETKEVFHIGEIIGKYFIQRGNSSNIALRSHIGFANNNDSPFAPFAIDSYINVRGSGNRILRGTALLSGNIEWRELIWRNQHWSFQTVAFSDIAFVRKPGGLTNRFLDADQSRSSIGLGSRIAYNKIYNAILRIDVAYEFSEKNVGFIIGLGQYF